MKRLLTRDEAAAVLGVSVRTIASYISSGLLAAERRPWHGLRDRVYIRGSDLRAFQRARAS